MLRREIFICCKCGKPFYKSLGGIVTTNEDMMFRIHPICDECKAKNAISIAQKIIDIFKK
jgi:RNase P subunit RPR2